MWWARLTPGLFQAGLAVLVGMSSSEKYPWFWSFVEVVAVKINQRIRWMSRLGSAAGVRAVDLAE